MEPSFPLSQTKPPTPTRRASPHIKVWLLPTEKAAIQAKAAAHTLSDSAYLRALGLDMPIRSTVDQETVLELARLNGGLARLGAQLAACCANPERAADGGRLKRLIADLEATQTLLLRKVEALVGKP